MGRPDRYPRSTRRVSASCAHVVGCLLVGLATAGCVDFDPVLVRRAVIATGDAHACAVFDGALFCAGSNGGRQLGVEDRADRAAIVRDVGSDFVDLAAGSAHTCLATRSAVECWGTANGARFGLDLTRCVDPARPCTTAQPVYAGGVSIGDVVLDLAAGATRTCILVESAETVPPGVAPTRDLRCIPGTGAVPDAVYDFASVPQSDRLLLLPGRFDVGPDDDLLVVRDDAGVQSLLRVRLVDGATPVASALASLSEVRAVAAGPARSECALDAIGLHCTDRATVPGDFVDVAVSTSAGGGPMEVCTLSGGGEVSCSLPDARSTPAFFDTERAFALSSGGGSFCAVLADRQRFVCWGAALEASLRDAGGETDARGVVVFDPARF